jgi:hypothetical protein
MAKLTKRQKAIAGKIEAGKAYNFVDAAALLTELSTVKFSESVDIAVNLGVDPRKSDQVVLALLCCRTALARLFALLCSPKAQLLKLLWLPALIALVWMTWLPR